MARGSKTNTAQSNSAKGASAQRKKGKNDAEERVALKDAPSRGRARARAAEEEASFEEFDREPRIFDDRTKRDIAGVIVAVVAVVLFLARGWGEIIIPLRVFRQIRVLKIAVEVGLVVGITAAITPKGSAIFLIP